MLRYVLIYNLEVSFNFHLTFLQLNVIKMFTKQQGGPRLSEISCTYDPPIYDITSGCRVAALFSREAQRWTPDAIWFSRYFNPQANGIMYLECREF